MSYIAYTALDVVNNMLDKRNANQENDSTNTSLPFDKIAADTQSAAISTRTTTRVSKTSNYIS